MELIFVPITLLLLGVVCYWGLILLGALYVAFDDWIDPKTPRLKPTEEELRRRRELYGDPNTD